MEKSFIAIGVKSIDQSINFYQSILNFKLDKRIQPTNDTIIAWLKDDNNFIIELIQKNNMPLQNNNNSSITLCFTVNDLNEKQKKLDENSIKYEKFTLGNNEHDVLRFKDPDNISISFIK
jgi:catechol 2,3-dioxygenase-like lactoylglutathione lyase family enzyme